MTITASTAKQTSTIAIKLSADKETIIDKADYDKVREHSWYIHNQGYAACKVGSKTVLMHQLIVGSTKKDIDHINLNKLDNRRSNLRKCNRSQNKANTPKRKGKFTSQYKGVDWRPDTKSWRSTIRVNYKKIHLGLFKKEEDAARAYDAAARKHFGEFARPNFEVGQ